MLLSDGRRLAARPYEGDDMSRVIPIHPDFRIIVLANRPGVQLRARAHAALAAC